MIGEQKQKKSQFKFIMEEEEKELFPENSDNIHVLYHYPDQIKEDKV